MISVVIPIYNGEQFIEETYGRITESEERDFEIIYVDDGSKDKSAEVIKTLAEKDARIRYFFKENGGIASARNYGLEKAAGEYICFIDQDDYVKKDMFSVMRKDMEEAGADIVKAGTNQVIDGVEEPACTNQNCVRVERESETGNHYLQSLILRGVSPHPECRISPSIWSCLFRTEFLKKNGIRFFSFCDYEDDWLFCIQAFLAAEVFCLEEKTLYSWRVHSQSESHNRVVHDRYLENLYEKHKEMREFLLQAVKNIGLSENEKFVFVRELQKQALLWTLSNETGRGIDKHTIPESCKIVKAAVAAEKRTGICRGISTTPLSISGYGMQGMKRAYHRFRDCFLTFLLLHHMAGAAVWLNKRMLHGRWHI